MTQDHLSLIAYVAILVFATSYIMLLILVAIDTRILTKLQKEVDLLKSDKVSSPNTYTLSKTSSISLRPK